MGYTSDPEECPKVERKVCVVNRRIFTRSSIGLPSAKPSCTLVSKAVCISRIVPIERSWSKN